MDFGFSEEQEMLRATIAKFMKKECSSQYVRECDEGQKVPFEVFHIDKQGQSPISWACRSGYRFSDIKFHKARGRNPSKSYIIIR